MKKSRIEKYNMISALSSGEFDKYGYYIGDQVLTSNQNKIIEQTKLLIRVQEKAQKNKQRKTWIV